MFIFQLRFSRNSQCLCCALFVVFTVPLFIYAVLLPVYVPNVYRTYGLGLTFVGGGRVLLAEDWPCQQD